MNLYTKEEIEKYISKTKKMMLENCNDYRLRILLYELYIYLPNGMDEAIKTAKNLLKHYSKNKYVVTEIANFFTRIGNYEYAKTLFGSMKYDKSANIKLMQLYSITGEVNKVEDIAKACICEESKFMLAVINKSLGDFEKSLYYLEKMSDEKDKIKAKMYLYAKFGKINEIIELYNMHNNNLSKKLKTHYKIWLDYINGNLQENCYQYKQISDYDKKLALQHIKNHQVYNADSPKKSMFEGNISVNKLLESKIEAIKIGEIKPNRNCLLTEEYLSKEETPVGKFYGNPVKFTKIVTALNTTNIITAYPVLSHFDMKQLEEMPAFKKIKRQ